MRIVHFSDTHICRFPRNVSALFDKRLIGLINFVFRRQSLTDISLFERAIGVINALSPDLVVCSGDLTSVGSPEEFEDASRILSPLVENGSFDFIYVPGNHDAYVPRRNCQESLHKAFQTFNRNKWQRGDLPCCLQKNGIKLFLVDSALPTNIISSGGCLSSSTLQKLEELLQVPRNDSEKRLMVSHYPVVNSEGERLPRLRRLQGDDQVLSFLEEGKIDILLSGHIHTPFKHVHSNSTVEISAGALTVFGKINVLDYDPDKGVFKQFWKDLKQPLTPAENNAAPAPQVKQVSAASTL